MIELNKIDENCSNIYLIDENTCYGDSLSVINTNVATLTSNLNNLVAQTVKFNQLFTLLSENSAKIINTIYNVNTINDTYESPYSTVKSLSSNWLQPFSLYYPKILEINSWYNPTANPNIKTDVPITSVTTNQTNIMTSWLELNFPNKNFAKNQIVYVFVNFYENFKFYYEFNKTYFEDCRPNVGGDVASPCTKCADDRPYQHCNLRGRGCGNLWGYCKHVNSTVQASYGCIGYNGKTLQLYKYQEGFDRVLSRIKSYKFINNSGWTLA
jgi:hypothetical protein